MTFYPPKAKRTAFPWAPLPASKTTTTTTMAINTQIATSSPPVSTTCKSCNKWKPPAHSVPHQPYSLHCRSQIGPMKIRTVIGLEKERREKKEQQQKGEQRKEQRETSANRLFFGLAPFMNQPTKKRSYPIETLK